MPVVLTTMPLGAPLAEMLWNVTSAAPMVVWMLRAVPVVVVIVLFGAVAALASVGASRCRCGVDVKAVLGAVLGVHGVVEVCDVAVRW